MLEVGEMRSNIIIYLYEDSSVPIWTEKKLSFPSSHFFFSLYSSCWKVLILHFCDEKLRQVMGRRIYVRLNYAKFQMFQMMIILALCLSRSCRV